MNAVPELPHDANRDLLIGLSDAELEALADGCMASAQQGRLDELLARHNEGQLSATETAELDRLLDRVDQLTLLKTRARYTLRERLTPNLG